MSNATYWWKGIYLLSAKDGDFYGSFRKKAVSLRLLLVWPIIQLICFNYFIFPALKLSFIQDHHLIFTLTSQYNEQKIAGEKYRSRAWVTVFLTLHMGMKRIKNIAPDKVSDSEVMLIVYFTDLKNTLNFLVLL